MQGPYTTGNKMLCGVLRKVSQFFPNSILRRKHGEFIGGMTFDGTGDFLFKQVFTFK